MSSGATAPSLAMTSLSIRDFRGINQLELDFSGPDGEPNGLVVLAGPNGCGKTAVLEAALIGAGGSKLDHREARRRGNSTGGEGLTKSLPSFDMARGPGRRRIFPAVIIRPFRNHLCRTGIFLRGAVPELIGPIDPTVGKRGGRRTKTDHNRLLRVKQRLVNLATTDRFQSTCRGALCDMRT